MSARALPDPRRSHGAWVVLCTSIAAGALAGAGRVELGLLVGTVFAGGFLALAALAMGLRRRRPQLALGLALALGGTGLLAALDPDPRLLALGAAACATGLAALLCARQSGVLAATALAPGLAALVLAAPAAALAAGASPQSALLLFLALWPFSLWRSLRIARTLRGGGAWNPVELRARGLRESAYAAAWALGIGVALGA